MTTFEKLRQLIADYVNDFGTVAKLVPIERETTWRALDIDSMDMVEIVTTIEDKFGIEFSEDAEDDIYETVDFGGLVDILDRYAPAE